jgi:radical SAM protein with 4Fe4S-binding SPASM domain
MRTRAILRREWFGGLLAEGGRGHPAMLDREAYAKARRELGARVAGAGDMRLVDAEEQGYPIRDDALSTPAVVYVEVTKRCDGSCTHCYASARPNGAPDELSFAEWTRVFNRLADGGAYYVRLSGGEPTLREDLFDLLDLLAEKGMAVGLNSHGRFPESTLVRLLEHGVRDFRLSVDGTEPIHNAIRGQGAFAEVVATLRRIAEYNHSAAVPADATMNVVLMKSTQHCIAPLAALAAELGCTIRFGLLRPAGRASRNWMLSPEEVLEAAREVALQRRTFGFKDGQARIDFDVFCEANTPPLPARPFPFDNSKCPIGTMGMGISATGSLMPCTFLGYMENGGWLGESVREKDVLDLWQTSRVLKTARLVRRNSCSDCLHYRARCNGGCPATAFAFTGDLDGRDPYCVRNVPLNPAAPRAVAARQASASPLLRAIRRWGIYNEADWTEYSQAFVPGSVDEAQKPTESASSDCDLAGRIACGEGARPVEPDFATSPKIIRVEQLARLKAQQGVRLGVVSGAYDLLHLGHLRNMRFARDRLGSDSRTALCALTLSDEAIRQKKGPARPVLNLNERLALLAAVRWIDYVVPLEQPDCLRALELLEPDCFFKSPADLAQASVQHEIGLVASLGGAVSFLPTYGTDTLSTTRLVGDAGAHSRDTIPHAGTAFSPADSLSRLRPYAPPRNGAGGFPEALYHAALAEVGLTCPPAWSGVKQAFLVTFDGPSGVGKDTQLCLLHRQLRQDEGGHRRVVRANLKHLDPFRLLLKHLWESPEFEDRRELVFGLLACARRYALDALLGRWLSDPQTIILQNRSFLSHVAYHVATPSELDQWLGRCAFDPRADLPLLLDCDTALASARVRQRSPEKGNRIHPNEQPDFILCVQRNFAALQNRMPSLVRIDTGSEPESVAAEIARIVGQRLAQEALRP